MKAKAVLTNGRPRRHGYFEFEIYALYYLAEAVSVSFFYRDLK